MSLDGDDAGKKAALSYVPIFLKAGLDARFATLPKDSDPDLILRSEGPEALSGIIREGIPMIDYAHRTKIGKTRSGITQRAQENQRASF